MRNRKPGPITNALLAGLIVVAGARSGTARAADEATVKLYKAQCSTCHGLDGRGQTTAGKPLGVKDWTDGKTLKPLSDEKIRDQIRTGTKGPDGKEKMAPYKKLTDAQITALIQYVRALAAGRK